MANPKKRLIKSLDTLSEDLKELIKRQYPNGYESNITRIVSPKKEQLFVFPLETEDAIYLVKIPVTKNSDGGYDMEKENKEDFGDERGEDLADTEDGGDDESESDGDDYDSEGGGKTRKEGSYDPDFDN
jgi:phosphopantothenoylcysteine synthetase/decarboxylase